MPALHEHSAAPASVSASPRAVQSKSDMIKPSPLNPQLSTVTIAILTAGRDRPYALGLSSALISQGLTLDVIGSDEVDGPELHNNPKVTLLKLRDQRRNAGPLQKMTRVLAYYLR